MGKPRMIILVRHAQSEGNLNRDVHQIIPDHRVKLTQEGWKQAHEAGYRLRDMLRPDDTIRVFTSPYRRTRETTEGLLRSLTESTPESGPSPFSRSAIKVYEEPRLREQDFGNFQPCSAEMERMWRERADYGHFFYRIPNGESAADAYDRCAGFNESLWRSFGEDDFPSVCILVTHGLMTRVFLMKWYHWTVEYFEDLRNVNHCEFVIMKRQENSKYRLESKLRTWSELKRRATVTNKDRKPSSSQQGTHQSPSTPKRQWGGCVDGCKHDHSQFPRRTQILTEGLSTSNNSSPKSPGAQSPKSANQVRVTSIDERLSQPATSQGATPTQSPLNNANGSNDTTEDTQADHNSNSYHKSLQPSPQTSKPRPGPTPLARQKPNTINLPNRPSGADLLRGRDAGGSLSGLPTPLLESGDEATSASNPAEMSGEETADNARDEADIDGDDDDDDERRVDDDGDLRDRDGNSISRSGSKRSLHSARRRKPARQTTTEDVEGWMKESGMGRGTRADALGDPEEEESGDEDDGEEVVEEEEEQEAEEDGKGVGGKLKRVEEAERRDRSLRGSVY
ncbi:Disintegrin and metalloproteinase domain-containing protein B [Sphaceloma murrayae]|uniref:Disintegrin and metalloproteinase domain-containing protein B n=1 Tax=Sphaceloma murrayae TaxID=2082308 RepID=A0A2K1QJ78_9PEZI|nr:Disintegrin and metalloproteinase domain-containing protein B [Sphaceloma murrayae]